MKYLTRVETATLFYSRVYDVADFDALLVAVYAEFWPSIIQWIWARPEVTTVTNTDGSPIWLTSDLKKIENAADYTQTLTYLDHWTVDERVNTIVYSSASLALSVTETYSYTGGAWTYSVSGIVLS